MAHKILIVEDNPVQMKLAASMLSKITNIEIFQAADGRYARESLARNKIDIVLCDIGLPGESGLELTRYMVQTYKGIVVIMLTADEDLSTSEKAIEYGAFEYLVKPVKPSQLRISIHNALKILKFQKLIRTQKVVLEAEIEHLKKTKQALENSEKDYNRLFENLQEGFYRLDEEGRILIVNPVFLRILGYDTADEIQGKKIINFYENPNDRSKLLEAINVSGKISTYEVNLKKKDNSVATVLVNAYLRKDENLHSIGIEGTIVDITSRKHLESELLQAQKIESIGRLAAGIAHEINTPIQYVGDNTSFMQDAFDDLLEVISPIPGLLEKAKNGEISDQDIEFFESAIENADVEFLADEIPAAISQSLDGVERVSRIVKSMKAFSHPGGEKKELADLNTAIQNTITVAKNEWKYVADLELELEKDIEPIPCYPGEINQVILNMIINASHAIGDVLKKGTMDKGKIRIQTRSDKDNLIIRIEDNGGGIPNKIKDRIFDPFFTTKEVGKGTGQGLAISRSVVVDKHGGEILMDSQPGQGTCFTLKLPRK